MSGLAQHPQADSGKGYEMTHPTSDGYTIRESPYGSPCPPTRDISCPDIRQMPKTNHKSTYGSSHPPTRDNSCADMRQMPNINHEPPYGSPRLPTRNNSCADMQQMPHSTPHQGSPLTVNILCYELQDEEIGSSADSKALPELPSSVSGQKTNEGGIFGQFERALPAPPLIPDRSHHPPAPSPRTRPAQVGGLGLHSGSIPIAGVERSSSLGIISAAAAVAKTVVLIGNPGVGKSAILNALGGKFESGISDVVGLTQQVTTEDVFIDNNNNSGPSDKTSVHKLHLIDLPGIVDNPDGKMDRLSHHIRLLQEVLRDERRQYVIFFVITPLNGRIDPNDVALMKLVLNNLEKGPKIGFIITQIEKGESVDRVKGSDYLSVILKKIGQHGSGGSTFLEKKRYLVLERHSGAFSAEKIMEIKNFILSFTPRKVKFGDIMALMARGYLSSLLEEKSK
ncbi:hypothetical protein BGZ96_001994 [Linnemannia gamsii]|uniref:G domain-containing protein n=1 Tax=Linnemannia gamsii TaxID=64522 RepID=A0ABQ7JLK1_9FUNG|nr:hypothetical protein BGZ96_001994 [Linnemannia gamsii]